jgi:penicillin G amidase
MERIPKRILLFSLLIVLLLTAGGGTWLYWRIWTSLPQLDGTLHVPGLRARVEVLRDGQGVPHLRAESLPDLILAQGYVTAQDRLWQMDLSRRLAEGELSEVIGERALRLDDQNRRLGFRQACERAVADLDPEARELLGAFARGVNAFITSHLHRLPFEFLLLHYQPRPWREMDSFAVALNMMKTLNTSWPDELMRERIQRRLTAQLYADLFPDHWPLDHPVAEWPVNTRSGFVRSSATSVLNPIGLAPTLAALTLSCGGLQPGTFESPVCPPKGGRYEDAGLGSNNWVVNGSHTRSGKPLLANDPHLGHSIPSVWYMIHLKASGLNVSGVSLPGLPFVIIGHNERIAWGMTNTGPDVQDLYVESFNLRDPSTYLHNADWVEAEVRVENIKVRNEHDYRLTVKTTRHGPVVSHDGGRDLALRWTALEPHALRSPFLKIDRAKNWQEFTDALREFAGPMQNFVYADVDGNIGYYAAGWVPLRKQGDGTVPSPGSTDDYDWTGYVPFEQLPHAYNPPSGRIATANGRIVPDGYPYFLTHKWEAPYRTARLYQLLEEAKPFTVADMLRMQMDIRTLEDQWLAGQLVSASAHRPPQSDDARYALDLLRHWDGEAQADSAATLVCEVTRHALLERILRPRLGDGLLGYHWPMSTTFLENVLSNNWTRWLPGEDASFADTLMKSLEEGVRRIPGLVHRRDHKAWKWGETIPLTFHHPLGGGFPLLGRLLDVGPFPQAGTGTTVKQTSPTIGPSMRMVVDLSDLDNSVQNITLGESGQALSPYYHDQFEAWYTGRSFPMLFSDSAVDKGTAHKLVLEPEQER